MSKDTRSHVTCITLLIALILVLGFLLYIPVYLYVSDDLTAVSKDVWENLKLLTITVVAYCFGSNSLGTR